ncbi:MAG: 3'(2'),5'-bisphosphate nucleotidase CysQ [Halioglobus sp.]
MSIHSLPLRLLCDTAMQAAQDAGEYIESVDRSALEQHFKESGSSAASQVVTDVDLHSEQIIRAALQPLSDLWDIAFVGEESSVAGGDASAQGETMPQRILKPYFWCVDPLDGTLPFVEGRPGYAVSIALVERSGNPLLGVVYDPVDGALMHAIKGQGAFNGGATLKQNAETSKVLTVFADRSFETHERYGQARDTLQACAQILGLKGASFQYGSGAVKNAFQVLGYGAACYVKLPKVEEGGGSIWDFAATACIVDEAGGSVSNIFGEPLALNRKESTFMNDQGVIYASSKRIANYLCKAFSNA